MDTYAATKRHENQIHTLEIALETEATLHKLTRDRVDELTRQLSDALERLRKVEEWTCINGTGEVFTEAAVINDEAVAFTIPAGTITRPELIKDIGPSAIIDGEFVDLELQA